MKNIITLFTLLVFSILGFNTKLKAQNPPELYGFTSSGGQENVGVLFKIFGDGSAYSKQITFNIENRGVKPYYMQLVEVSGKLYGTTNEGGFNNVGVIFEYDIATNTYTKKIDFNTSTNGGNPNANLYKANNGKLYGLTNIGGTNNLGTIFEYDPSTNNITVKHNFDGPNGRSPKGSVIQAADGNLYGLTYVGGSNSGGVIFKYNLTTSTYTKVFDFTGTADGWQPYGNLVEAPNGKLYGMTYAGGSSNFGALFEFDPSTNGVVKKIDFVTTNGKYPYGSLSLHPNGNLWGMTREGGTSNQGVLFEYVIGTNTLTKKYDFFLNNGRWPYGSLYINATGMIYGMTSQGGSSDAGVIFRYDNASSSYKKLEDLNGTTEGKNPYGTPMIASNGKMYALTFTGASAASSIYGILFEFDIPSDTITKTKNLNYSPLGKIPFGSLIQEPSNGKLYGVTNSGGTDDLGVIMELDPTSGNATITESFNGIQKGGNPYGELIKASNNKYYGTTTKGGVNSKGAIIEITLPGGTITNKYSLATADGTTPYAALLQHSNGKLYGVSYDGGANTYGSIFEFDPATSTFTKKHDFALANGGNPKAKLVEKTGGVLIGTTYQGGTPGLGVIFEYNPATNTYTKRHEFNNTDGKYPEGGLLLAANGKYYGMTNQGGSSNLGVLYEYDATTGVATKKIDFAGASNGANPKGGLIQASDGLLYGMTSAGGTNSAGVIFSYNTTTNILTVIKNFSSNEGAAPYGSLIELNKIIFTQNVSGTSYCAGDSISVPFNGIGTFGLTNTFTAELSDASGSFAAPVTLGTLNAQIGNQVAGIIPSNTVGGTGYLVRVVASSPSTTGSVNATAFTVKAKPVKPIISFAPWDSLKSNAPSGNQWYYNGTLIPGATNAYHIPTSNGVYWVTVTGANGCLSDTSNNYIFLTVGLSASDAFKGIAVYPNPTTDLLNVKFESAIQNANITVTNILGEVVYKTWTASHKNNEIQVPVAALPAGYYILNINAGENFFKSTFIKE